MAQDQQNAPLGLEGESSVSVLQRKIASGRADHQARAMTLARALRLSVAKVADNKFDMAIATLSLRTREVVGADLGDLFDDNALLLLLDGPNRSRAAAMIDPALVSALIQQQTMGVVLPHDSDETRPMTHTDAAICAPFLDRILEMAALMPEADAEKNIIAGFRFGARAEDARLLQLSLEAPLYHVIQMEVDVAQGNRQGGMILCMPLVEVSKVEDDSVDTEERKEGTSKPMRNLAETVPELQIELSLVLSRIKMRLRDISSWKTGDVLALDTADFDAVEVRTSDGRQVGKGVLGQLDGFRAVRIAHKDQSQELPRQSETGRQDLKPAQLNVLGQIVGEEPFNTHEPSAEQAPASLEPQAPDPRTALPVETEIPDMSDIPDFDDLPHVAQG